MNQINVGIAGITGWVGQDVARAVRESGDLRLRAGVARSAAGQDAGAALGDENWSVPIYGSLEDALDGIDVLVDYTSHTAVRENVLRAVERGVHVVVGSSGLTVADYEFIGARARSNGATVIAAGNFSISAALVKAAAVIAARHMPNWEIIDYAFASKPDAPSGTARELAEAMSESTDVMPSRHSLEPDGPARGEPIGRTRIHSLRLDSFSVSTEVVFGLPDERLTIRHDAGESARPYVAGTLLAIREAPKRTGLIRGLDQLLGITS
jgi:4-hydroxy-tetrahydrodipicolinate reductase